MNGGGMHVISPMWLMLLAPWGALALWLMWGRHSATRVPFLDLWRGAVSKPSASRLFRPPPLAIIAALAALLLAILAAARPMLQSRRAEPPAITMIVDRGITMSARRRVGEVLQEANELVARTAPQARIERIDVPETSAGVIATRLLLRRAVSDALARTEGAVIVLSDQPVQRDPRIVQIAPTRPVENVAIVRFAIRERPALAAMVEVRNDSDQKHAELIVESVKQAIELPARGKTWNYFVDLPNVSATPHAQLAVDDDLQADNTASLARRRDWPRVEIRSHAPAEVQRVVQAYQKARPAGEQGATILVTSSANAVGEQPAVIVGAGAPAAGSEPLQVRDHPITAGIDWSKIKLRPLSSTVAAGFTPVISAGSAPIVSVSETPVRRVRIDFDAGDFARTSDFVVLWTQALDWLSGGGGESFPAFDAPAVIFPTPPPRRDDALAALTHRTSDHFNLLPYLALTSLGCAALAAYAWPRPRLTAFSTPRTV